jgi:hypothetical protein
MNLRDVHLHRSRTLIDTPAPQSGNAPDAPRKSYCWLPVSELQAGMRVAKHVLRGMRHGGPSLLPAGSEITANTISQLFNKGVECVAVFRDELPDEAACQAHVEQYEARLHEIFGNSPSDDCRPLLEALLKEGPDAGL